MTFYRYIEERLFKRFVEACLEETVVIYVDLLLTQKTHIREETIERMRLDEEILMDFFTESISISKAEKSLRILSDLRELASADSFDTITHVYANILEHYPDCPICSFTVQPAVVQKLLTLREGIPREDAKEVVKQCKELHENSLGGKIPPKSVFGFSKVKCLNGAKGSIWGKLT
ncbi:Exocyst complex component SEC6 [Bienertia sinuspersici]